MPLKGVDQTITVGRTLSPPPAPQASFPHTFADDLPQDENWSTHARPARPFVIPLRSHTPPRVESLQRPPPIDQYDGPSTARKSNAPQPVPPDARRMKSKEKSAIRASTPGAVKGSGIDLADLKMPVPNTLPTTQSRAAMPLKHETSQTTDDSARESDVDSDFSRERQARGGQHHVAFGHGSRHFQQESIASSNSNNSTLFNPAGYNDVHSRTSIYDQPEPTALFRGLPSQNPQTAVNHDFKHPPSQQRPLAMAKAQQKQNFNLYRGSGHDDLHTAGTPQHRDPDGNESTSLFEQQDFDDMHARERGPSHDETPSKVATQPPKKNVARAARAQSHSNKQTIAHSERGSSPLDEFDDPKPGQHVRDPNLPKYHEYGLEHRDEFFQAKKVKDHDVKATLAPAVAKVPESNEVSDDDHLPTATRPNAMLAHKRPFDQIDYEDDDLRTMRYADLDTIPFLTDPRHPPAPPTINETGAPITLSEKLSKLTKMKPDDQKLLFRSLTDSENEEAGQWFVESFGNDLKKLMETRLERRKVALKFELEAKMRQTAVETKQEDIETELSELRQGGGKLLEGRDSPRPLGR